VRGLGITLEQAGKGRRQCAGLGDYAGTIGKGAISLCALSIFTRWGRTRSPRSVKADRVRGLGIALEQSGKARCLWSSFRSISTGLWVVVASAASSWIHCVTTLGIVIHPPLSLMLHNKAPLLLPRL
jgi:hypothetical protein